MGEKCWCGPGWWLLNGWGGWLLPPDASYGAPRPKQYKTAEEYLLALGGISLERVLQVQPALVEAVEAGKIGIEMMCNRWENKVWPAETIQASQMIEAALAAVNATKPKEAE